LFCIFCENFISSNIISHSRLFKESRDGERYPIFPEGKAFIYLSPNEKYIVKTTDNETVFIGIGLEQALNRIHHAQPNAEIEIIEKEKRYSLSEYYRHIAPVVYLIATHYDDKTDRLAIAYECGKNSSLIDEGTKIFANDDSFANWLVAKLTKEERPPVVKFADWLSNAVSDRLYAIELNRDYKVVVARGTWPALRKKAQEAVISGESA